MYSGKNSNALEIPLKEHRNNFKSRNQTSKIVLHYIEIDNDYSGFEMAVAMKSKCNLYKSRIDMKA